MLNRKYNGLEEILTHYIFRNNYSYDFYTVGTE